MSLILSPAIQISLSTAEESVNYFTGDEVRSLEPDANTVMPAGTYRIVDDRLFQIVEGPKKGLA